MEFLRFIINNVKVKRIKNDIVNFFSCLVIKSSCNVCFNRSLQKEMFKFEMKT